MMQRVYFKRSSRSAVKSNENWSKAFNSDFLYYFATVFAF